MTQGPDVSQFVASFSKGTFGHPYGATYQIDVPEDLYHSMTYHTSVSMLQTPLVFRPRMIEDSMMYQQKQYGMKKRRGAVVTASPYDFHGLVEPAIGWNLISSIEGPQLIDAAYTKPVVEEDICFTGKAKLMNNRLLSTRPNRKVAIPTGVAKEEDSIMEDPIIKDIVATETKLQLRVLTTVKLLAAIGVCNRSVCPFELVFTKKGKDIYVSTRAPLSPALYESSIETITIPNQLRRDDLVNDFMDTIQEASDMAASFIAACQSGDKEFTIGEKMTDKPLLYRRIVIGDIEFIIRCDVDVLRDELKPGQRPAVAICRTFNDIPSSIKRTNWAVELEKQRSALLLGEVKDNANMFARWVAIGRFMKAEQIFVGYVERKNKAQAGQFAMLAADRQSYGRNASMISLTEKNLMGILSLVFSRLVGQEDGIYHFQRDSKKRNCKIYKE